MKSILPAIAIVLSSFTLLGQETPQLREIILTKTSGLGSYVVNINEPLLPNEFHALIITYKKNRFVFKNNEALSKTAEMYLEGYDNMTITWDLTPTEEKALQKYVKVSGRQDSKSKSDHLQLKTLKNLGVGINGSVLPSEIATSLGGSVYITYYKFVAGYTYVLGENNDETRNGNAWTRNRIDISLSSASIGYEVAPDLFLKGGFGVYHLGGRTSSGVIGVSVNEVRLNEWIETPSFGVLYMNTPYHFNFGFDLIGVESPLMLFSVGFNL